MLAARKFFRFQVHRIRKGDGCLHDRSITGITRVSNFQKDLSLSDRLRPQRGDAAADEERAVDPVQVDQVLEVLDHRLHLVDAGLQEVALGLGHQQRSGFADQELLALDPGFLLLGPARGGGSGELLAGPTSLDVGGAHVGLGELGQIGERCLGLI